MLVALPAIAFTAALACTERKTSDRDLVLVDCTEAMEIVQERKKLLGLGGASQGAWVDPRSEKAFREGHIPGAISLPYQNVTADHQRLSAYDVVIVYGDDYRDAKARAMSKRLMELGLKDVRTLRGGLRAWTDAGNEIETGP
jgi:3-mercaptopyruvate sulfurtransferase SseA